MKILILFLFLLSQEFIVSGQSADDILCKTEDEYRKHFNYIDHGQYSMDIYQDPIISSAFNYFIAMDREGDVYHWISEFKYGKTIGTVYDKKAKQSTGTFLRLGNDEAPFPCSLYEAGGRLLATGGGILWLSCSLFYPDFLEESPGDDSHLQFYAGAERLPDSIIQNEPCYVVGASKTIMITEKMADDSNRRGDSIRAIYGLPPVHQSPPFKKLPGEVILKVKYYIHKNDFLIVRLEESTYEISQLKSRRSLNMNPLFDVKDFIAYLKE